MNSPNKQTYNRIQRAVRQRSCRVPFNGTWQELHDALGVGVLDGQSLILSAADRDRLRGWARQEFGADPLQDDIGGDRLAVAAQARNEKWATEPVFSGMMQVNVRTGAVPLRQGSACTPPGTLLAVTASELLTEHLTATVLVENGIVARRWAQCHIPPDLTGALMVYRGHSSDVKVVSEWLDALPSTIRRVGYFDFDPAGIGMAIDYKVDALLIPTVLDESLVAGFMNKPESFSEQMARRPALGGQLPAALRDVWQWMVSHRCAVTQESLTVSNRSLRLLPMLPE